MKPIQASRSRHWSARRRGSAAVPRAGARDVTASDRDPDVRTSGTPVAPAAHPRKACAPPVGVCRQGPRDRRPTDRLTEQELDRRVDLAGPEAAGRRRRGPRPHANTEAPTSAARTAAGPTSGSSWPSTGRARQRHVPALQGCRGSKVPVESTSNWSSAVPAGGVAHGRGLAPPQLQRHTSPSAQRLRAEHRVSVRIHGRPDARRHEVG